MAKIIPLENETKIFVILFKTLFINKIFLFKPTLNAHFSLYTLIMNAYITEILARNDKSIRVKISRNYRVNLTQKVQYDNCYFAPDEHHMALKLPKKKPFWKKRGSKGNFDHNDAPIFINSEKSYENTNFGKNATQEFHIENNNELSNKKNKKTEIVK